MDKIQFEAGTKISDAKVTINGVDYIVTPAEYSGNTPLSSYILNLLQTNIERAVVPTGGTTGQVLVKKSDTDNDVEWQTGGSGGASGDTLPIGSIVPYSSNTIPTNWLLCNGQAVSREDYSYLFSIIGTTYGTGDGSTTFNLPDLRGRVPVGKDSNDTDFDTLGKTRGEKTHTLTIAEMPSHQHNSKAAAVGTPSGYGDGFISLSNSYTQDPNFSTGLTGGGQAHNNIQPSIVQNYIIKAFQSSGVVANVAQVETDSEDDVYSCKYINDKLNEKHYITAYLENNQSGGQNTTIQLNQTEVQKGNLTLSNNKVVIGQGISKVRISGEIFYQDFDVSNQYYLWGQIKKNNSTIVARCMTAVGATSGFDTCSIATKIIEVQQGDVIELNFGDVTNHTVSVRGGKDITYLSVEAVE